MKCRECQDVIQRRLDGEAIAPAPAFKAHLDECRQCREDYAAAQILLKSLSTTRPYAAPANMTMRIVGRVLEDRRKRHVRSKIRWYAIWSMAAAVLVIVGVTSFFPQGGKGNLAVAPAPVSRPAPSEASPTQPELDRSVEEAKVAVAALTERVAVKTRENALLLWQAARHTELPEVLPFQGVVEIDDAFDPAAQSLQKAGQAVTQGLEPMARSAARAFDFFSKEFAVLELPPAP
jgi:hypothetical protein